MKYWVVHFLVVVASFRLFAGEDLTPKLGSGGPGLRIIWNTTNQYIIFNDLSYVKSLNDWPQNRQIQVLAERNFGILAGDERNLYPFDEEAAFACTEGLSSKYYTNDYGLRQTWVFSTSITNRENILVSRDVYSLARSRYGLATNQLFLGKIGTNIFYFENRDLWKIYYRSTKELQATHYFKLPRSVDDVDGVTMALNTNKDVAVCGSMKAGWFLNLGAPYHPMSIEFSFKDAKHVRN
jgi:hypothetical protein